MHLGRLLFGCDQCEFVLRALPLRQPLHAQGAYFRTKTTQRGALFGLISFGVASPSESWRLTWLSHWIAALDQVCTQVPLDRTLILTVSFSGMKQGSRPLRIHRLLASYVSSWSNRASPLVRLSSTHTWPENHFSLRHESALHPAFAQSHHKPPGFAQLCSCLTAFVESGTGFRPARSPWRQAPLAKLPVSSLGPHF